MKHTFYALVALLFAPILSADNTTIYDHAPDLFGYYEYVYCNGYKQYVASWDNINTEVPTGLHCANMRKGWSSGCSLDNVQQWSGPGEGCTTYQIEYLKCHKVIAKNHNSCWGSAVDSFELGTAGANTCEQENLPYGHPEWVPGSMAEYRKWLKEQEAKGRTDDPVKTVIWSGDAWIRTDNFFGGYDGPVVGTCTFGGGEDLDCDLGGKAAFHESRHASSGHDHGH